MKMRIKKIISMILALCLILSAVPVSAATVEQSGGEIAAEQQSGAVTAAPGTPAVPEVAEEVTVIREEESLRGEYEKHFLMSDGSYQAEVYAYPVHELVDGVWVELAEPGQNARGDVTAGRETTNILDNFVWEDHGVQSSTGLRLYIGSRSGYTARTYIQFATMPTIPAGATITAATMKLTMVSGTSLAYTANAYQVTGGEWDPTTIQWTNKPAADVLLEANISNNDRTKYQFSVLTAVQHWYNGDPTGQNENYGIMLRYYDETLTGYYNSVYSGDVVDTNSRPRLTISYTPPDSEISVLEGYTKQLPLPDTTETITWTSADTSVATVNSSGIVTGVKAGKVTITAAVGSTVLKSFTVYIRYADGVYYIKNLSSGYYLSAKNGKISEGTTLVQTSKASSTAAGLCQMWKIKYLNDGRYSIRPLHKLDMGLGCSSGVMLREIGTSDTYSGVEPSSRWTINYNSNGYELQKDGSANYSLCIATNVSGASVTTSSSSSATIFRWLFEDVGTVNNQVIMYDTATEAVVTNATRSIQMGETLSLNDLGLTAAFVSKYSIDQSINWSTIGPSKVSIDKDTGTLTGLMGDKTTTIIATHIYNGINYQSSYSLSITPIPSGTYFIRNAESDKNIDVNNGTLQNSATTRQMSFTGSNTQRWVLTHLGDDVYSIKSAASTTAYYLTGNGSSGHLVMVGTGSLTDTTKWNIRFTENGTFVMGSVAGSNNNLALAVATGATSDGTVIQQLTYTDDANREDEWELCAQKDYTLMYLGYDDNDPQMVPIIEAVDGTLKQREYVGYASRSMTVTELMEHLSSSEVVSCISHGNSTGLLCSGGEITIEMVDSLDASAFDNLTFVYLGACSTGAGQSIFSDNLVNALSTKGAGAVLGFGFLIEVEEADFWSKEFMVSLAEGNTIGISMAIADVAIANEERFQGRRLTVSESRRYFVGDAATIPFD